MAQTVHEYSSWQTVYSEETEAGVFKVEICFYLPLCESDKSCRYKTRNEISKDNRVSFKFDYLDCDNITHSETVWVDLNKLGEYKSTSYFFYGKSVTKIHDAKLDFIVKNKKGSADGILIEEISNEKSNESNDKKIVDAQIITSDKEKMTNTELTKLLGKTRTNFKDSTKVEKFVPPHDPSNPHDGGGRRGANQNPKVESIAITEETPNNNVKKSTPKKK